MALTTSSGPAVGCWPWVDTLPCRDLNSKGLHLQPDFSLTCCYPLKHGVWNLVKAPFLPQSPSQI